MRPPYFAKGTLADRAVEVEVVEVDVGLKVDFLGAAVTHRRVELEEEEEGWGEREFVSDLSGEEDEDGAATGYPPTKEEEAESRRVAEVCVFPSAQCKCMFCVPRASCARL